jgi:hypothetical protein
MAVIGASAVEFAGGESVGYPKQKIAYFGIVALGLMMIGGLIYLSAAQPFMIVWGFGFLSLTGILLLASQQLPGKWYGKWLLVFLLGIDFLGAGLTAYQIDLQELRKPKSALGTIIEDDGYYRIYSPSYSVPQHLAAEYELELTDGVDPLQIGSYVEYVQEATGVPQEEYSVTIPPFKTGDPSRDNRLAKIDSKLLGLLNVKYVVSEFELEASGLTPVSLESFPKVYRNENLLPRAWIETGNLSEDQILSSEVEPASIIDKTANTILLQASGPGKLVVSEIYYPGWQVYLNGEREEINISHDIFRSVSLPEGTHRVLFRFEPISVFVGFGLSVLGWIGLALILIRIRLDRLSS